MDPDWLRHLLNQGQDSLAGTGAEWENFDRFVTELESDWRDAAGQVITRGHLDTVRAQSRLLRDGASNHVAVLEVMGGQALDFAAARSAHDTAAASFGRARSDALSDLDEALSDAAQAARFADAATGLATQAASLAAQLRAQS